MPPLLLTLLGVIIIAIALWSLLCGKIITGIRGLQRSYYYRNDNPFSFYGFVMIYLSTGSFILYQSLS